MSTPQLESFLAKIYVDETVRNEFLADPRGTAEQAGLAPAEIEALVNIDRVGLELAVRSLTRKREKSQPRQRK